MFNRSQMHQRIIVFGPFQVGNQFLRGGGRCNQRQIQLGMPVEERTEIMMAIGNHDEKTGTAVSDISAALILADKSDVHRDRVTNQNLSTFDIHDRVNYAVTNANLELNSEQRKVILNLTIDTKLCPVLDYFEIFMDRTMMSKYAAKYLKIWFELVINNTKLL